MKQTLFKPLLFLICLSPAALLAWQLFADEPGANPIDEIADATGTWALRFVLISLLMTPLKRLFGWPEIWLDIVDRPVITVDMAAFLTLVPLAVTSNRYAIRKPGKKWKTLHRLAYVAPVLGVLHFWWLVKADVFDPLIYAVLPGLLLAWRLPPVARLSGQMLSASRQSP